MLLQHEQQFVSDERHLYEEAMPVPSENIRRTTLAAHVAGMACFCSLGATVLSATNSVGSVATTCWRATSFCQSLMTFFDLLPVSLVPGWRGFGKR